MDRAETYKRVFLNVLDNIGRAQGQEVISFARRHVDLPHLNPE